ncbi:helix-turn-helix and ligand-binding sensor domain-containing protein [Polaribacter ponticola]|uniref:Triple tyrosine motif-containing protein n=1 Tax=Polaribacter ponticola TaxID=2978475 RepID=A0ABT5S8H2_9FLAO|nr:triple tyrosine motif-containing protein [Polaribacter sp. MSW5]MDD7914395.1 triple tyrosine motif-containing protein [Polaribacter sp. MSW5]
MRNNLLYSFFFIYLFTVSCFSQEVPPINIFSTEDYGAENQNWAISQGNNKFIYVANNEGLLEYNGSSWQLYPTPNESIMRSVKNFDNKVYTGFYMDFGYWKKDEFGVLKYVSIADTNKIKMLEDEQIWEIEELDGWMIFKSLERIYLYNLKKDEIKIINAEYRIHKLSKVDGVIYFQENNKGVYRIENGVPKLISEDKVLKENIIVEIFKKNNKLLFLTQKAGFYILEDAILNPWKITSDEFLSNKTVYSAKQLKNNDILLGTISNGIIVLNSKGEFNYQITQSLGLSNNTVLSTFEDIDNNIWLGLDNGINSINLSSPFGLYVEKNNFWGTIYASIVFNDYLYLGTNQGLYYRKNNSGDVFKFIKNTQGQVWNLQVINNVLFCGHDTGTFIINKDKANNISNIRGAWGMVEKDKNTLIQGNYHGLIVFSKKGNTWSVRNKIKGFSTSSRYFVLKGETEIFVNHEYKGVFKLDVDKDFTKVLKIHKYESIEKGIHSSLINYQGDIYYSSKKGVYKYNEEINDFKIDTVYSKLIPSEKFLSAKLLSDNTNNKLWSFTEDDIRFFTPGKLSNKPDLEIIPIKGSVHKGASGYENIVYLSEEKYLIGARDGYLVVDLNNLKEPNDFKVNINKVYNNVLDSEHKMMSLLDNAFFNSNENNLEFFYSVPNYNSTSSVKYQYQLEGLNEKWSKFSNSNSLLFKNLSFGEYTFKVRATMDNKLSSNIAEYSFNIAKPWYISNFMMVIYILGFLILGYVTNVLHRNYYRNQREKLLEKAQKELELKELESSQKIIKLNNDKLRSDIASKNRELATSTMSIIKKNEFLSSIKNELAEGGKQSLANVVKIIDKNLNNTDDWKMFQEAFNNADKKFLKKIKSKHPELTPNDLRLCAYLRLNLSSKEIAPLLNISPRSVEVKRYRLRKKMNLLHDKNLTSYILEI